MHVSDGKWWMVNRKAGKPEKYLFARVIRPYPPYQGQTLDFGHWTLDIGLWTFSLPLKLLSNEPYKILNLLWRQFVLERRHVVVAF